MKDSQAAVLAYALSMLLLLGYVGTIAIALARARHKVRPSGVPAAARQHRAALTTELKPEVTVRAS